MVASKARHSHVSWRTFGNDNSTKSRRFDIHTISLMMVNHRTIGNLLNTADVRQWICNWNIHRMNVETMMNNTMIRTHIVNMIDREHNCRRGIYYFQNNWNIQSFYYSIFLILKIINIKMIKLL